MPINLSSKIVEFTQATTKFKMVSTMYVRHHNALKKMV